jgi:hypothetical protein
MFPKISLKMGIAVLIASLAVTPALIWSARADRWSLAHDVPFWGRLWLPTSGSIEGLPVHVPLSYGIMPRERGLRVVYRFPPMNRGQTLFFLQLNPVGDKSLERLRTQEFKDCEPDSSKCMNWFADQPRNMVRCTEMHTDSTDTSIGFGFCRPGGTPVIAIYSCEDERCESARQILVSMFRRPET